MESPVRILEVSSSASFSTRYKTPPAVFRSPAQDSAIELVTSSREVDEKIAWIAFITSSK